MRRRKVQGLQNAVRCFSDQDQVERAHPVARDVAEGMVRWQPLPCLDLFCELHSPLEPVLQRAKHLFTPSRSTRDCHSAPALRWRITHQESPAEKGGSAWQVHDLNSGAIQTFKTEHRALTCVEYAAVRDVVELVKGATRENPNYEDADFSDRATVPVAALFALHGALLHKDGRGIIVVGPSEAGKSTLSCALWQHGWSLLSDDFCFIRDRDRVYPGVRRVSLRPGSRALLGEEVWNRIQDAPSSTPAGDGWLFHPHEVDAPDEASHSGQTRSSRRDAVRVGAFVFLGRRNSPAAPAQMLRHNPALATLALLPYCTLLPRTEESSDTTTPGVVIESEASGWGMGLARMAPVTERVPVYDLGRGPLDEMVAAVERWKDQSLTEYS
jgi:hypothetical protein